MNAPILRRLTELRALTTKWHRHDETIGVVPTMGALHQGHLSLVKACGALCEFSVVTIFVNPTQFAPGEDFEKYPRDLDRDLELLQES